MSRVLTLTCLSLLIAGCGGGGGGGGPTLPSLVVTSLADNGQGTLRQALDDAWDGSKITFDPALAGGAISLFSDLPVQVSVEIEGPASGPITLDGNGNVRHFYLGDTVTFVIRNLILVDGSSLSNSGSIFGGGASFEAWNCTFSANESGSHGGVLAAVGSTLMFVGCHFIGNQAERGGVLRLNNCDTFINLSSFAYNSCTEGRGGAIVAVGGQLVVRNTTLHGNVAFGGGGAIDGGGALFIGTGFSSPNTHLGLYGCTLTQNEGPDAGGGLLVRNDAAGSTVTIDMRQTIIAESTALTDPDLRLDVDVTLTAAYSLVGVQDAATSIWDGLDGNIVGDGISPADPMLDALVPNWTGTLMRPALPGSPVRDVVPHDQVMNELGDPLELDQRLFSRLGDVAADIGAVETIP